MNGNLTGRGSRQKRLLLGYSVDGKGADVCSGPADGETDFALTVIKLTQREASEFFIQNRRKVNAFRCKMHAAQIKKNHADIGCSAPGLAAAGMSFEDGPVPFLSAAVNPAVYGVVDFRKLPVSVNVIG